MRDRWLASASPEHSHFFAVDGTSADIASNLSCKRAWHTPNDCRIGPVNATEHKIARKCVMRGLCLGHDHQPARILIKAMNDTWPSNAADSHQARAAMVNQGIDQCPVEVSRGRVDNQPGRLVDDDQMPVLEPNIQRDRLRDRHWLCIVGKKYDEILAAADP
jgi:hypothetical protein